MGRLEEALALFVESLAMREQILGENDPLVANSVENIGHDLHPLLRMACMHVRAHACE